jgi:GNAT superfamily N-acetyltransferase
VGQTANILFHKGAVLNNIVAFPGIRIEPFTDANLNACSAFLHKCWHQNYASELPAEIVEQRTLEHFRHYLTPKQGICWVAFSAKRVVGLISVSSNCVEDLWVDDRFQHRKLGSRLLDIALHHFRQKGFQSAQVGCESFNHNMVTFFTAKGWHQIGSEPVNITAALPVEALVFSTRL